MTDFFKNIGKIKYEGPNSENDYAFRHYNPSEIVMGKTLEEAKEIKNKQIVDALELPPIKIHCSVLAEDSIKQAIKDFESKQ